jgi:hypothetical protein
MDRFLLYHLDGAHDRGALVDCLLQGPVAEGVLRIQNEDRPGEDATATADILGQEVDRRLAWLARIGLLVG